MKRAGYKIFWVTNQQTMTARNTMLTVFSKQADKRFYMNQQYAQNARKHDTNVLKPFQGILKDPASEKLIIIHLLGTHIKYKYRYPENQNKFDNNTDRIPPGLDAGEPESRSDYDDANLYNDHVVTSLIKDSKTANPNGFLIYFSDHGEEAYGIPPRKIQGRNEDNLTRHIYTVPLLLWTSGKWQATHPRDFPQDADREYSLTGLIRTWSDLIGLPYNGYNPTHSAVNPQLKETTR